jgi:Fe-S cluster assembly ATP-binding protein
MLEIRNLHVSVDDKPILRGIGLTVKAGEVHAVMGPNGSGKSTLAHVLAGRDRYVVTAGEVLFDGANLLGMLPEERARAGVFLAFQCPVEIPGVSNIYLLKAGLNAIRKHRGEPELDAIDFLALACRRLRRAGCGFQAWLASCSNVVPMWFQCGSKAPRPARSPSRCFPPG